MAVSRLENVCFAAVMIAALRLANGRFTAGKWTLRGWTAGRLLGFAGRFVQQQLEQPALLEPEQQPDEREQP